MKSLFDLLAANRGRGLFRAEQSGDEATVYLYDSIVSDAMTAEFWGGVAPIPFIQELSALTAPVIHLRINSPGGDVFAARAMEQALREHPSKIVAHVDGYAASAASYLALAADEVVIAEGGFFMIHKAWTGVYGNADDLIERAALLNKIDDALVTTYVNETGNSPEQVAEWMAAETWFSADEAVKYGFADSVAAPPAKKFSANWDMSAYARAPVQQVAAVVEPEQPLEPIQTIQQDIDHLRRKLRLVERTA